MERITGNEVKSMMEAYASVYKTEEQEVISEEVAETEELQENQAANRARQQRLRQQQNANRPEPKPGPVQTFRDRIFARRSASPAAQANTNRYGQNIKVGPITGPAQNDQLKKPAPQVMADKTPAQSPSSNLKPGSPSTVVSPKSGEETKFERRLPSMAELRAAQAARKAAKAGGASDREAGYQAVKAGVGVSKGTVKDPKIAADAARKAELAALQAKAKADTMKKKPAASAPAMSGRARMREELDVFDTIKEYLIGEGATEEEALQQMLTLTDEQRTEIIEGSCGSKKKKKGGYGK